MRIFCVVVFLVSIAKYTDGLCTLPVDLRGDWTSADKGIITFTDNEMRNYKTPLSATISQMDFSCQTLSDGLYYMTGLSTFSVFGEAKRPHICMDFHQVTTNKFYYHVATTIEPTNNDRVYVKSDSESVTHSNVCNRQKPYETGTFVMLIRDGTDESNAITCPSDMLNIFDTVNIQSHDGSTSCSGSRLDVCSDKTTTNFTYNGCSNTLTFSDGGAFKCLYYISFGELTYVSLWNMDTTVTAGQNYRIVCYVIDWQKTRLAATAYPGSCHADQTASSGVVMTMTDISVDCDREDGFDLLPYYVGAIALCLLIVGLVGVCVSYKHYKNAEKTNRVHAIKVKPKKNKSIDERSSSGVFSYTSSLFEDENFRNISTSTPKPPQSFQHPFIPINAVKKKNKHPPKAKTRRPEKVRPKLTSPPTRLNDILHTNDYENKDKQMYNDNDIFNEIHDSYTDKGEMQQSNVRTTGKFYRQSKKRGSIQYTDEFYRQSKKPGGIQITDEPFWQSKKPGGIQYTNEPYRQSKKPGGIQYTDEPYRQSKQPDVQTAEDFYRNQAMHDNLAYFKEKPMQRKRQQYNYYTNSLDDNVYNQSRSDRFIKFSERHNIFTDEDVYKSLGSNKPRQSDGPEERGRGTVTNTVHYFDRRIPMHWK